MLFLLQAIKKWPVKKAMSFSPAESAIWAEKPKIDTFLEFGLQDLYFLLKSTELLVCDSVSQWNHACHSSQIIQVKSGKFLQDVSKLNPTAAVLSVFPGCYENVVNDNNIPQWTLKKWCWKEHFNEGIQGKTMLKVAVAGPWRALGHQPPW